MERSDAPSHQHYVGEELEIFKDARNWKWYFKREIAPFVSGDVLEVGAGLGSTTEALITLPHTTWTCLEPDSNLSRIIETKLLEMTLPPSCRLLHGNLDSIEPAHSFDAILYIDVLEHIEDDRTELQRALKLLRPLGHLIILSPAHAWLYSEFDRAIGHFRRYTTSTIQTLTPPDATCVACRYLDSIGMAASLANKLLLKRSNPTLKQILFWDRAMVPLSRICDPLFRYRLGKSVLAIWQKDGSKY